jgi:hypothetical protein
MSDYERVKQLVSNFHNKKIDMEQLKLYTKPYIDSMNIKGAELAKKHGVPAKKINLQGIMRNMY